MTQNVQICALVPWRMAKWLVPARVNNLPAARRPEAGSGGVKRFCRGRRAGRIVQARRKRARIADQQRRQNYDRALIPLLGTGFAPGTGDCPPAQTRDRPSPATDGCRKGSGSVHSRRVEDHLSRRPSFHLATESANPALRCLARPTRPAPAGAKPLSTRASSPAGQPARAARPQGAAPPASKSPMINR